MPHAIPAPTWSSWAFRLMAEKYGFSSVGVDNNREQCDHARSLTVQDVEEYLNRKTTQ